MTARLSDNSVIQINPETFAKQFDNQFYIITYTSDEIYALEETGLDIWNMIQESPMTFAKLCEKCKEAYEVFDKDEVMWLKDFLIDLNKHELIKF